MQRRSSGSPKLPEKTPEVAIAHHLRPRPPLLICVSKSANNRAQELIPSDQLNANACEVDVWLCRIVELGFCIMCPKAPVSDRDQIGTNRWQPWPGANELSRRDECEFYNRRNGSWKIIRVPDSVVIDRVPPSWRLHVSIRPRQVIRVGCVLSRFKTSKWNPRRALNKSFLEMVCRENSDKGNVFCGRQGF